MSAEYLSASFPAWREQAAFVISQGQSLNEFIAHCHPDHRSTALKAYRVEYAAMRQRLSANLGAPHGTPTRD